MTSQTAIPSTQYAVQLVGPSELKLNTAKEVFKPGPTQILLRMEAVGLCFSDLKLLKQFTAHVRKGEVINGLSAGVLSEIPGYVPGELPTVPGHEVVARIVAAGGQVRRHEVGERVLVQADWRELRTASSNAAFGYDFEGGLQEYVLLDERVVIDPKNDERYLIPVGGELGASSVALIEPWACVEDAYVAVERRGILPGGRLLVVAQGGRAVAGLDGCVKQGGKPRSVTALCPEDSQADAAGALGAGEFVRAESIDALPDESFDDIVYFGSDAAAVEALGDKLAGGGIFNIVTGGGAFGGVVNVDVGRVHYGRTRWTGTTDTNAAEGYRHIPKTGEIRDGEKLLIVGAGGPMGQMHVIRDLCTGRVGVSLTATDFDTSRLESLARKAGPLASANGVELQLLNPNDNPPAGPFSYITLMAPLAKLVSQGVADSTAGCMINIFAGIPAGTRAELDMDKYLANKCWMFGTSGSTIQDMKLVLQKVQAGRLDTDLSVGAICGMAGAIEGIEAVEKRTVDGKIIVYPALRQVGLIPLGELAKHFPAVAEKLENGHWTAVAEEELLKNHA